MPRKTGVPASTSQAIHLQRTEGVVESEEKSLSQHLPHVLQHTQTVHSRLLQVVDRIHLFPQTAVPRRAGSGGQAGSGVNWNNDYTRNMVQSVLLTCSVLATPIPRCGIPYRFKTVVTASPEQSVIFNQASAGGLPGEKRIDFFSHLTMFHFMGHLK